MGNCGTIFRMKRVDTDDNSITVLNNKRGKTGSRYNTFPVVTYMPELASNRASCPVKRMRPRTAINEIICSPQIRAALNALVKKLNIAIKIKSGQTTV